MWASSRDRYQAQGTCDANPRQVGDTMNNETYPPSAPRLIAFVRSVLPAEPAQLLLLAGATLLFISPEMRWWPRPTDASLRAVHSLPSWGSALTLWASLVRILSLPILAAGSIGYFACFRRNLGNSVRTLLWILACALIGLSAVCGAGFFSFMESGLGSHSLFSSYTSQAVASLRDLPSFFMDLGPGLRFSLTGLLMVAIFTFLLWTGRATLPMRLSLSPAQNIAEQPTDGGPWDLAVFVPVMIGLVPLLHLIEGLTTVVPFVLWRPGLIPIGPSAWFVAMSSVVDALFLAAFVLVAMGKERKEVFPRCLRLPKAQYLGLAVLLPAAVFQVWPTLSYLRDRIAWAHMDWGLSYPPQLHDYFGLPQPNAVMYLLAAFAEEIAWRGYLQPRFIRRYGLWRGVFLVGFVWAAFHFSTDFRFNMSDDQVFIQMAYRFSWIVSFSYFLPWLTIRSGSILPCTIAHGVYNMFVLAELPSRTPSWILVPLLALLSYVVFRFWPPVGPCEGAYPDSPDVTQAAASG